MPPAFVLSQDQTLQKKYFEEPIWLLLLKEINLTWSRVQRTLDPHIRFLIGSMFSFERTNFKCLATLAFVSVPYRVDLYIIPQRTLRVNTFLQVFSRIFTTFLPGRKKQAS